MPKEEFEGSIESGFSYADPMDSWSIQEWVVQTSDALDDAYPEFTVTINVGRRRSNHEEIYWTFDANKNGTFDIQRGERAARSLDDFVKAISTARDKFKKALSKVKEGLDD